MTRKQPKKPEIYYRVRPLHGKGRKLGEKLNALLLPLTGRSVLFVCLLCFVLFFDFFTRGKKWQKEKTMHAHVNCCNIICPCQNPHWPPKKHSPTLQNKCYSRLESKQGKGSHPLPTWERGIITTRSSVLNWVGFLFLKSTLKYIASSVKLGRKKSHFGVNLGIRYVTRITLPTPPGTKCCYNELFFSFCSPLGIWLTQSTPPGSLRGLTRIIELKD